MNDAARLLEELVRLGWSVACAESLTGGLVTATLVDVPGASRVLRGGVIAYDTAIKASVVGVDDDLLAREGAVHPEVARQLAERVRVALATDAGPADVGIGTTGVAGPDMQDGQAVGTVHVAVATPQRTRVQTLSLPGGRAEIRRAAVASAIGLALQAVLAADGADPESGE